MDQWKTTVDGLGKRKVATPLDLKFFDSLPNNEVVSEAIRLLMELNGPRKGTPEHAELAEVAEDLLQWILSIGFFVGGGKSRRHRRRVLRRKHG
eukprot:5289253-Amphidinium_carterae.1